jgi:hypothetical protein
VAGFVLDPGRERSLVPEEGFDLTDSCDLLGALLDLIVVGAGLLVDLLEPLHGFPEGLGIGGFRVDRAVFSR